VQEHLKSFQDYLRSLRKASLELRIDVLEMLNAAGSGHVGGALSALDMMIALYYGELPAGPIMKYDPEKPGWEEQDYFVLSKAHAVPALYAVLADLGFFPKEELKHLRQLNSLLQAYPSRKIPGISLDAAAPAHGFSAAIGLALALKMDKKPNRVFCLVGDGELQEGQIWEGALVAAHNRLDNLTLLVDCNDLQMDGLLRGIVGVDPIADKFQAFGWKTVPVRDGHDFEEMLFAYERALENQRRPSVVIAKTVKGKGVTFAENKGYYHAEVFGDEELAEALPKLKAEIMELDKK
jgi:transketolase